MSDADDQMGGHGGKTGPDPDQLEPGKDNAAPVDSRSEKHVNSPENDGPEDTPTG